MVRRRWSAATPGATTTTTRVARQGPLDRLAETAAMAASSYPETACSWASAAACAVDPACGLGEVVGPMRVADRVGQRACAEHDAGRQRHEHGRQRDQVVAQAHHGRASRSRCSSSCRPGPRAGPRRGRSDTAGEQQEHRPQPDRRAVAGRAPRARRPRARPRAGVRRAARRPPRGPGRASRRTTPATRSARPGRHRPRSRARARGRWPTARRARPRSGRRSRLRRPLRQRVGHLAEHECGRKPQSTAACSRRPQ